MATFRTITRNTVALVRHGSHHFPRKSPTDSAASFLNFFVYSFVSWMARIRTTPIERLREKTTHETVKKRKGKIPSSLFHFSDAISQKLARSASIEFARLLRKSDCATCPNNFQRLIIILLIPLRKFSFRFSLVIERERWKIHNRNLDLSKRNTMEYDTRRGRRGRGGEENSVGRGARVHAVARLSVRNYPMYFPRWLSRFGLFGHCARLT